jgi:hypothetical protein
MATAVQAFDRGLLPSPHAFYEGELGHANNRGWSQANCCFHNSKSKRLFSVNVQTGGFIPSNRERRRDCQAGPKFPDSFSNYRKPGQPLCRYHATLELPRMRKQSRTLFTVVLFCSFTLLLFCSFTQLLNHSILNPQPRHSRRAAASTVCKEPLAICDVAVRKYTSILIPQPTHGVTATT